MQLSLLLYSTFLLLFSSMWVSPTRRLVFPEGELTPLCYGLGSRPETRDRAASGPPLIV